MGKNKYFSVSILMPTLNAATVLEGCLRSIAEQDYPKERIEIIVADGGSTDDTIAIAKKFGAKVFNNPLKTAEAGKAVAFKKAKSELVALIDSDNILPNKNWLKKMTAPFENEKILGSEPWQFTHRFKDGFIDRYCAMMGMNDPICYFLGNYDRLNMLSGKWTGLRIQEKEQKEWMEITFTDSQRIPTIGANGAIFRKDALLKKSPVGDYLFDIDLLVELSKIKPVLFAKVKTGMVHLYCGRSIGKFIRKQRRRIKDYLFFQKGGGRHYPWQNQNIWGIVKFVLCCLTFFPLFWQALKGYFKSGDTAWFFHPLACWITLLIYSFGQISSLFKLQLQDRTGWKQ